MVNRRHHEDAVRYYRERYEEIVRLRFVTDRPTLLQDHEDGQPRLCRFCGRGKPDVTFRKDAHAVPEFLGNNSVLSLNECDECNKFFADEYEDHLAKWSMFSRAVARVEGKNGVPKFKSRDGMLVVEGGDTGFEIRLRNPELVSRAYAEGDLTSFRIPAEAVSQPYVPVRAAMALLKVACSVCPPWELGQCRPVIDMLLRRNNLWLSKFTVLFVTTAGPLSARASDVVLLRRKGAGPDPYLWCVLQWSNFRFQFPVPFCPANGHDARAGEPITITTMHYPTKFGPDWGYGETRFGELEWSGSEPIRSTAACEFDVQHCWWVNRPGDAGTQPTPG
jgi:hypothetical protein